MAADRRQQQGFTLVETLIALTIFSVIAMSGVVILRLSINSNEQLERSSSVAADFQTARSLIKADFAQVATRRGRDEFGNRLPGPVLGGEIDLTRFSLEEDAENRLLSIVSAGNVNPGNRYARSRLQYIEYLLVDDRIIRRAWNYPDRQEATPLSERTLFAGVTNVEIAFLANQLWEDRFVSSSAAPTPPAVELRFDHPVYGPMRQLFYTGGLDGTGGGG